MALSGRDFLAVVCADAAHNLVRRLGVGGSSELAGTLRARRREHHDEVQRGATEPNGRPLSEDERNDAAQAVHLALWKRHSNEIAAIGNLRAYARKASTNLVNDWDRRRRIERRVLGQLTHEHFIERLASQQPCEIPDRPVDEGRIREDLLTALENSPIRDTDKVILSWRYFDGPAPDGWNPIDTYGKNRKREQGRRRQAVLKSKKRALETLRPPSLLYYFLLAEGGSR